MYGNYQTGTKLSDDLQSTRNSEDVFDAVRIYSEMFSLHDVRTDAHDVFRRFPKILPYSLRFLKKAKRMLIAESYKK